MRLLICYDNLINEQQLKTVVDEVSAFYKQNGGDTFEVHFRPQNFTNVPYQEYYANNYGIRQSWLRERTKDIRRQWSNEIDNVVFVVHDKNWKPDKGLGNRIWGWSLRGSYNRYFVQQCRFDPVKKINTFGTLYHELMHSHDDFVYAELAKNIEDMVGVTDWDEQVVHGKHSNFQYIGKHTAKENEHALQEIMPLLRQAVERRKELYDTEVGLMRRTINELQKVAELYRMWIMKQQKGDVAITPNCIEK